MLGGIGKVFDKAVDFVKNPVGTALDIAGDSFGKIVKEALKQGGGELFGGTKSLGDLLDKLRGTKLGDALSFKGKVDGKEADMGLNSDKLGLPPHLAEIQPAVDAIAQMIGGDCESSKLLADLLGGAISGSKDPAEALANLQKLASELGLDSSAVSMMLQAMRDAGIIPAAAGAPSPGAGGGAPAVGGGAGAPGGAGGAAPAGGAGGSSPKTPLGGNIDGAGGFLYKPFSDSDGKLVVLTPEKFAGQVASVVVRGPDGSVLAEGKSAGNGNGGRDHFRFDRPGSSLPANVTVEVRLRDGSTQSYPIANPSLRYD